MEEVVARRSRKAEAASSRGRGMPYHEERPRFSAGDWSDRSGISAIMPAAAPPLLVSHPLLDSTDLDVVRAVTGRAWGKHASDVIGRDGLSASLPPGVPLAEAALLARIGEHLFGEPPPPGDEPPRERVVVEVLLDWLRAHRAEPVSMGDLAAHAGVSVRAVEQAFASHVGAPPMACLRAMRLDLARRLLEAAPAGSNVTAVVLEAGINHLGRFAGAYQQRYGELPSETLLRSRERSSTAGREGASQNGYRDGGPVS